jgi:hypothetical protein
VIRDFLAWVPTHPEFWSDARASAAFTFELTTSSVPVTPIPGDRWSVP